MSVLMKKPRTETVTIGNESFKVPSETAKAVLVLIKNTMSNDDDDSMIMADDSDMIQKLDAKYGRAGATLQGARLKEGLTQEALAEKLSISQTNLSKMEHGKRPIGKNMAKRIAKVLNVDYRIFL